MPEDQADSIEKEVPAEESGEQPSETKDPKPEAPKKKEPVEQEGEDPLDGVVQLMKEQKFDKAAAELRKMLRKKPDDPVLLHNLGAILTEQCKWEEAEEIFYKAFDVQKEAKDVNYATLFGLATVLTEQGGTGKLMQAEALFRDYLDKACVCV